MKDYEITYLAAKLVQAGIIHPETVAGARQTIYSWMRKGRLTLRRKPTSDRFVVNNEEADKIIKNFSSGGSGKFLI
jgi:hypothetical protein